jgi:hypothetical protein
MLGRIIPGTVPRIAEIASIWKLLFEIPRTISNSEARRDVADLLSVNRTTSTGPWTLENEP